MNMSKNHKGKSPIPVSYKGIGLAAGLVLGGLVGLLIGNLVIFAGGGMVLGLAVGSALDSRT